MQAGAGQLLQFQIYQDAARTVLWGSNSGTAGTQLYVQVMIPANGSASGTATLYGQVLAGQNTAIPANYTESLVGTQINVSDGGSRYPTNCNGGQVQSGNFDFTVTATVSKSCTVTAGAASTIDLGSVAYTAVNTSASSSIGVTCSNSTPYYVGLSPNSTASTSGAGAMSGTGSNTDKVPYQLYSNASLSSVWGNTATSTSVGNGVAGTGTGSPQTIPVYVKVPSANHAPDSYSDTVTVNVNY